MAEIFGWIVFILLIILGSALLGVSISRMHSEHSDYRGEDFLNEEEDTKSLN